MFEQTITSEAELRELMGWPTELVQRKVLPALDEHCRNFIAHSPFVLVSTANAAGECDVSPRGDLPGSVLVLDSKRLVIAERPGNRRMDTLRNILSNPHIGLLFLLPGMGETLRVNGEAVLTQDPALLEQLIVKGKRPQLAIGVTVNECYLHCAKAFRRSGLWEPERWPDRTNLPTAGTIFLDHMQIKDQTAADLDCSLEEAYTQRLY